MDGEQVLVGYVAEAPTVFDDFEHRNNPGLHIEIIRLFCKTRHHVCRFRKVPNNLFGIFDNGTWNGLVKQIQDGIYDLGVPFLFINEDRFSAIDYSSPIARESTVLVTRHPQDSTSSLAMFQTLIFHWYTWLALMFISIFIGAFVAIIETPGKVCYKLITNTIDVFSFITNQTGFVEITRHSVRFMLTFWGLATLILSGFYSSNLLSLSISTHNLNKPFSDLESFIDCVESTKCQLVLRKDNPLPQTQKLLYDNDTLFKRFQETRKYNPILKLQSNDDDILKTISGDKQRFLVSILTYHEYLNLTTGNELCKFFTVEISNDPVGIPMSKHSKLKERVNVFATDFLNSGIYKKLEKKYIGIEKNCENNLLITELRPINLMQFFTSLFVLLVGGSIGLGVLFLEWVKNKFSFVENLNLVEN